ncbi:FMN-dependent NADH-azoreductase [Haloplasma contractile]|nr:NAD(P)H-dependent oxidoreductase [Haloplasma contractile]
MKTLLYITCNSKPETLSASKTVGRELVEEFLKANTDYRLNEVDLYEMKLPRLKYKYFENRNKLIGQEAYNKLTEEDQKEVDRIKELAIEFKNADCYVIATPMWSILFPAPLKEYLDCIIQNDITIKISRERVEGLLDDKKRSMVYIQSSGGSIPLLLDKKMNHGGNYIKDIFKFLGIKDFHEVLVDGTGFTEEEEHKAVEKGKKDVQKLVKNL